ncbi:dephospho-CoA kinase [SAR92 clade bacterium H231]|nr:dephospho-CoA kinase [Porticoccaceae bacterium]MCT2531682.1 dephospho-CoA kinase [SAR92 clade bacterium H231]MBT6320084.1 dephospho-CoA kinase [Porticoccaceae bacterium]MBT7259460.1 dephospho-CoA kinase [Porticoccaceae bacterium]MBT7904706.1 dephospho-CoA kinase [Porticoccaceae bacterium]
MAKKPLIIGLTGGIGSGKSTVAEQFAALGIVSVDADQASRAVVEPGMPALDYIEEHFGPELITADGQLNRPALREIIFADPSEKAWLEALLHPLIRDWIMVQLQAATSDYVILESPLLFETDQHQLVDAVLLVDVPVELQLERASARDGSDKPGIQRIIDAQMPRQTKRDRADFEFDNAQPMATIAPRVLALHQQFLTMAQSN